MQIVNEDTLTDLITDLNLVVERKAFPVGTKRTWASGTFKKTKTGWVRVAGPKGAAKKGKPAKTKTPAKGKESTKAKIKKKIIKPKAKTEKPAKEAPPKEVEKPALDDAPLSEFGKGVLDTVASVGNGDNERYGDEKVFIAAAYKKLSSSGQFKGSAGDFKKKLVKAMAGGHLIMARADLVGAMPKDAVASSEIEDQGATFHFILDPTRDPYKKKDKK